MTQIKHWDKTSQNLYAKHCRENVCMSQLEQHFRDAQTLQHVTYTCIHMSNIGTTFQIHMDTQVKHKNNITEKVKHWNSTVDSKVYKSQTLGQRFRYKCT